MVLHITELDINHNLVAKIDSRPLCIMSQPPPPIPRFIYNPPIYFDT